MTGLEALPAGVSEWLLSVEWTDAREWLLLTLMGFATGVFGVMIGAGGGFVLVPILRIFFDKDPVIVAGTALALVALNAMSGTVRYRMMRLVDSRSAYMFALVAIPGSVIAPFVLGKIVSELPGAFDLLFGVMLLVFGLWFAIRKLRGSGKSDGKRFSRRRGFITPNALRMRLITTKGGSVYRYRFHEPAAVSMNFALGFLSSFFGVGGGFLRTPILVYLFNFPVRIAAATSLFALAFYSSMGAMVHLILGNIEWFPTFAFSGLGLWFGGQLGARVSGHVGGDWIMGLLALVTLGLGAQLVFQGVWF